MPLKLFLVFKNRWPDMHIQGEPLPPLDLLGVFSRLELAEAAKDGESWIMETYLDTYCGQEVQ